MVCYFRNYILLPGRYFQLAPFIPISSRQNLLPQRNMAAFSLRLSFSSSVLPNPSLLILVTLPKSRSHSLLLHQNPRNLRVLCSAACPNNQVQETSHKRWESFRKKKVVMRVGYVGTDYRGTIHSFCIFFLFFSKMIPLNYIKKFS